jgi:hypothetical protein
MVTQQLTVDDLTAAVQRLSPAELREFKRRLADLQAHDAATIEDEALLIRITRLRPPAAAQRRLKRLIAGSERGTLTSKELLDYRDLAQQAEQIDAMRVAALAELVRRRRQPVAIVKAEIGWGGGGDGSESRPA